LFYEIQQFAFKFDGTWQLTNGSMSPSQVLVVAGGATRSKPL